jgi:hypothetical protein
MLVIIITIIIIIMIIIIIIMIIIITITIIIITTILCLVRWLRDGPLGADVQEGAGGGVPAPRPGDAGPSRPGRRQVLRAAMEAQDGEQK